MEHRYSNRVNTDIQALIYKCGLPVVIGRIRNLSRHGIYVQCSGDEFVLHQPLEIELFMQGSRSSEKYRFKCFLTRKEAHGLALAVFDDCQPQFARDTAGLVNKFRPATSFSV